MVMSILYIVSVKVSMLKKCMISWGRSSGVSIWDKYCSQSRLTGLGFTLGTKKMKRMAGVQTLLQILLVLVQPGFLWSLQLTWRRHQVVNGDLTANKQAKSGVSCLLIS